MKKYLKYFSAVFCVSVVVYLLIPTPEFKDQYSTVIYDRDQQLLGAQIADDGQWRFSKIDSVPDYFKMALLTFEDKRFYDHHGIDFLSLSRAIIQNIKAQKVISGASTITMQVCRMSRGHTPRTVPQKLIEMAMAIKTELTHSKEDILKLHASHAPFGGNVVGLEAASWRYYAKPPEQLGLAESALLAVLPNAPALIHPGRNRTSLKNKRNKLLKKLYTENKIDSLNYELALLEGLPAKPKALPRKAPHLLQHIQLNPKASAKTTTTIDSDIQKTILRTAELFSKEYQQSDIQNIGILVLDTQSGEVLGYVGNSPHTIAQAHVDMIQAGRSSGSVLKPLLYAHALDEGLISPSGLVKDIPLHYNGYRPQNYNKSFSGAVKADEALTRSLNIPAVQLLQEYKVDRFISKLKRHGFKSINKSADHYGLSLILGSADVNLWELTSSYASLARILHTYKNDQSRYKISDLRSATYIKKEVQESNYIYDAPLVSAAAIHHTFEAMQKVSRPNEEGDWQSFSSTKNIAWKTGTSYGHRDAWAIGVSPQYSIGVWVGNADGEGKHDLIGVKKAAPVLFDVLNHLDYTSDFPIPYDDLAETVVCRTSGFTATHKCTQVDTVFQIEKSLSKTCPYHIKVTVYKDGYRVHGQCESPSQMTMESFLVLPSDMAHYYRRNHPEYRNLPDYRSDCRDEENSETIKFIYPSKQSRIYLPTDGNGEKETAIFKVAHQKPEAKLFWHLNDEYLGMTEENHSMAITALAGQHKIMLIDEEGSYATQRFEIIGEE